MGTCAVFLCNENRKGAPNAFFCWKPHIFHPKPIPLSEIHVKLAKCEIPMAQKLSRNVAIFRRGSQITRGKVLLRCTVSGLAVYIVLWPVVVIALVPRNRSCDSSRLTPLHGPYVVPTFRPASPIQKCVHGNS